MIAAFSAMLKRAVLLIIPSNGYLMLEDGTSFILLEVADKLTGEMK